MTLKIALRGQAAGMLSIHASHDAPVPKPQRVVGNRSSAACPSKRKCGDPVHACTDLTSSVPHQAGGRSGPNAVPQTPRTLERVASPCLCPRRDQRSASTPYFTNSPHCKRRSPREAALHCAGGGALVCAAEDRPMTEVRRYGARRRKRGPERATPAAAFSTQFAPASSEARRSLLARAAVAR